MNVQLGETFDNFVAELIANGLYESQSEVLREALQLLKEREDLKKLKLEELKQEVKKGIDQLERGEFYTYSSSEDLASEIKAEGRKKLGAMQRNTQA
ncbi:MAG: type II toxin-antitoxin system ParD family antitoxin [Scytonematopsis contorta HA4267-MV1]|jgi:antitoxin ParD1/3/4|nr:type II toxin-antitoxin system ParD family antitoxin [Scytonematopsis contorta HA4267-MV1]